MVTFIYLLLSSGAQVQEDQHYLPLYHKKEVKGAGSKDKPSSTQGGNGEEYKALGNIKVRPGI